MLSNKNKLLIILALLLTSCSQNAPDPETSSNTKNHENNASSKITICKKYFVSNPKNDYEIFINSSLKKASKKQVDIKFGEFNFDKLNNTELVQFFNIMQECKGKEGNILTLLSIESKDTIWRRALSNLNSKNELSNLLAANSEFEFNKTNIFYDLEKIDKSLDNAFSNFKIDTSKVTTKATPYSPTATGADFRKLNVLQVSVEAHNAVVGGISTVMSGLMSSQNEHLNSNGVKDINPIELTPFYDIIKIENSGNYKLVGYLDHYLDGKMFKSTIYTLNAPSKITQYLIQPDPNYAGTYMYYLGSKNGLYGKMLGFDALAYFTSATAAFASLYHGENGSDTIDVVHAHNYPGAFTNVLLKRFYAPLRLKASLPKIATIMTIHGSGDEKGLVPSIYFNRLGHEKQIKGKNISLHVMSLLESDAVNAVSNGVIGTYINPDPKISHGIASVYKHLIDINLFSGIANGIDYEAYNPRNEKIMGNLTVASNLSNLTEKKALAKQALFDANIISSPTKPLYMYVGRFGIEKGVDHFPKFAEYVLKRNGQVIFMGSDIHPDLVDVLNKLKELNNPNIKVFTNVKEDQLSLLPSVNAKKGFVIRLATDFSFIPSNRETFGLVALEGLIMGSTLITSNVEGLQDITIPYNSVTNNIDSFNSVTYAFNPKTSISTTNMINALNAFDPIWDSLSDIQKSDMQKRNSLYVEKFTWNAPGASGDKYKELYIKAMSPLSPDNFNKSVDFKNSYAKFSYNKTL